MSKNQKEVKEKFTMMNDKKGIWQIPFTILLKNKRDITIPFLVACLNEASNRSSSALASSRSPDEASSIADWRDSRSLINLLCDSSNDALTLSRDFKDAMRTFLNLSDNSYYLSSSISSLRASISSEVCPSSVCLSDVELSSTSEFEPEELPSSSGSLHSWI